MDTKSKRQGVPHVVFRHCMEEISRFPSLIPTGQLWKSLLVRTITVSSHFMDALVKICCPNYV